VSDDCMIGVAVGCSMTGDWEDSDSAVSGLLCLSAFKSDSRTRPLPSIVTRTCLVAVVTVWSRDPRFSVSRSEDMIRGKER
jgi:hypothetical protein